MLLRDRLTAWVVGGVAVTVAAFGVATDAAFGAFLERQARETAEREARRAQEIVEAGRPGDAFLASVGDVRLQFVGRDGNVRLPGPSQAPLPEAGPGAVVERPLSDMDGRWAVAAAPWRTPAGTDAGTVRVAVSMRPADRDREALRRVLLAAGVLTIVASGAAGAWSVRRGLRPLGTLARAADAVDPADPRPVAYRGPDDEVARLADGLNRALDGIRKRRDAERERLADVAHELAAPVTVVAARLRRLAEGRDAAVSEPDRRGLEAAQAAADDLLHASNDLLTLARGDLDERLAWEVRDVGESVRDAAGGWGGVRVEVAADDDLRALIDPVRLRQVVRNLVRNAVKAADAEEGVRVHVARAGEEVALRVEDDGPGLDAAARDAIFGRYVAGSGGTGLGLAVVRRLVDAMGGTVRAEARGGPGVHGAIFEVRLPSAERAFGADPHLDGP